MEHRADELYAWRLVGILLLEMHDQSKCSVLERGIGRTDYDGVPSIYLSSASILFSCPYLSLTRSSHCPQSEMRRRLLGDLSAFAIES